MRAFGVILLLLLLAVPAWSQDEPDEPGGGWIDEGELVTEEVIPESEMSEADILLQEHVYIRTDFPQEVQQFLETPAAGPAAGTDSSALLQEILSSDAFKQDVQPQKQDSDLMQKFTQWFSKTINSFSRAVGLGAAGTSVIVYVLVVIALALMAMIIRQLILNAGGGRSRRSRGRELDEDDPDVDLGLLAERHAAGGDYRLAVRYRFLAVLRSLDLPSSSLTTNSMLLRQVRRGHPGLHAEFASLVSLFEDAWYGSMHCSSAHYREASSLAGTLDSLLVSSGGEQH